MITLLFLILSFLFCVEASTSISRKSGYAINNAASGLILQSSLGLLSRALIFMFMPLIGALSDTGSIYTSGYSIILSFLLLPSMLFLLFIFRVEVERIFLTLLKRVGVHGSYFKKVEAVHDMPKTDSRLRTFKKFKNLYIVVFLSYIPYYLAWPFIIILLNAFPENRGFILGLSSVFNGINTLILTLFVDPKLAKLGMYKNIILSVYNELLLVRLFASLSAFILFLIVSMFI
jgi:hypothetical protein